MLTTRSPCLLVCAYEQLAECHRAQSQGTTPSHHTTESVVRHVKIMLPHCFLMPKSQKSK